MADIFTDCHECSRECINDQFCGRDGEISLPKRLKVKVIANPAFWGFNDGSGNILTRGEAIFSNGHYDFFDGYDELHFATKQCGELAPIEGPFRDEQRPDVLYRSVYDPDDPSSTEFSGRKHYGSDGSRDDIERGGAEVYLIDRAGSATSDLESCDTSDPTSVYKTFPENFGFGTKISATDTIFKNKTGAWRYVDIRACYDSTFTDSSIVSECDGTAKQNIILGDHFSEEYDDFQIRASGERGCIRDGAMPAPYSGVVKSVFRASGVEDFIRLELQYQSGAASGIFNGKVLGLTGDYLSGTYAIFGVSHSGSSTYCKVVGTLGSGNIYETGIASWVVPNSFDPNTCCGGAAHGINPETMSFSNTKNYHSDLGRIFNNNKNKNQSNRFPENRSTEGFGPVSQVNPTGSYRANITYPSVDDSGAIIESGFPVFDQMMPYYGPFYEIDKYDTSIRNDLAYNTTQGNNGTCFSKKETLSIFPDCITQYRQYNECETNAERHVINQVSRLGIVYRGCDFDTDCSHNNSGDPYFAPSNINDLKRGLAGQEIYMYINLSNAWGPEIKRDPCGCGDDVPPGNQPPIFVEVPSPVTFPSFPKFDLYPEEYGCRDKVWQSRFAMNCESGNQFDCPTPSSQYACDIRQPYTTYGFIRNVCGNEYQDKRLVITNSFSSLVQQGDYRNTSTTGVKTGPMYWEFTNPYVLESGKTGGFSSSGNYPFWGVSDSEGRLVSPLFRAIPDSELTLCGTPPDEIPYLGFDLCSTRQNGWPTNETPFLLEIDHSDDCVNCASISMNTDSLVMTIEGLSAEFSHGPNSSDKYGFNHCRYKGIAVDPVYHCDSGYQGQCNNNEFFLEYNDPYTGNTCSCMASDISLFGSKLKGTNKLIGWSSKGPGKNSFVKLDACTQNATNTFLNPEAPYLDGPGFDIYGSFKLACDGMHKHVAPAEDSGTFFYTESPLDNIYGGGSCGKHFPSANSDLKLTASFALIPSGMAEIFSSIPEQYIYSDSDTLPPITSLASINAYEVVEMIISNQSLGCTAYLTDYGCANTNGYGQTAFYPCVDCPTPITPLCDCDGIVCDDCGDIREVDGNPSLTLPYRYSNNPCLCDCNLQPMRVWKIENGVKTIHESFEPTGCSGVTIGVSASGTNASLAYIQTYFGGRSLGVGPVQGLSSSFCGWHSGPNAKASGIQYEFSIPGQLTLGELKCSTLTPSTCESGPCEDTNVGLGSCGDPISFTGVSQSVTVNKRSCYPEAMVVNKIECLYPSGFKLYVDREYHSHDRTWNKIVMAGSPPAARCFPVQKGAYRYTGPSGEVCIPIPFATPSDSVTPAYYVEPVSSGEDILYYRGVCSTNPSSGQFVTQDFVYGPSPIASGEDITWNYFNLFYGSGYPSAKYHPAIYLGSPDPDADPPDPENPCADGDVISSGLIFSESGYEIPAGRFGVDWTNKQHSCLQDYSMCGGDVFCNKLFFPRKKYASGTKVIKFGALQICKSNSERTVAEWYSGYQDFDSTTVADINTEIKSGKFIDACKEQNISRILSDVGIDSTEIIVDDYLPLFGLTENNFRYTIDTKNCIIVNDSCLSSWVPTHSDYSISAGVHRNKTFYQDKYSSYGYYLDKTSSSIEDNCLLRPFKILVDVECCNSNIRTTEYGDPTMLEFVVQNVPSWACDGFVKDPSCGCEEDNICGGLLAEYAERPRPVCISIAGGNIYDAAVEDIPYSFDQCGTGSPCPPADLTTRPGFVISNYDQIQPMVGVYLPQVASPAAIALIGGGPLTNFIGCSCGDTRWGINHNLFHVTCGGVNMLVTGESIGFGAYECGDFYYVPTGETGCCIQKTICQTLPSCWKIPKGSCFIMTDTNHGDYSADLYLCEACKGSSGYSNCEDSVIKVTITEGI